MIFKIKRKIILNLLIVLISGIVVSNWIFFDNHLLQFKTNPRANFDNHQKIIQKALEITVVTLDILTLWLAANFDLKTFWLGGLLCITYGIFSFLSKNIFTATLYLFFYSPSQIIGYFKWKEKKKERPSPFYRPFVNPAQWPVFLISIGLIFLSAPLAFKYRSYNSVLLIIDFLHLPLGMIAQILMVRAKTSQWYIWIIINILSILQFSGIQKMFNLTILTKWVIALLISIFGLYKWSSGKIFKTTNTDETKNKNPLRIYKKEATIKNFFLRSNQQNSKK